MLGRPALGSDLSGLVPLTGVEPVRYRYRRILSDRGNAEAGRTWRPMEVVGEDAFPRFFRGKCPQNGQKALLGLLIRALSPFGTKKRKSEVVPRSSNKSANKKDSPEVAKS